MKMFRLILYYLGWSNRDCRRQIQSILYPNDYLISLVDTKEECQALCDATLHCYSAVFDTWDLTDGLTPLTLNYTETVVKNHKKFGRCKLGEKFDGRCDRSSNHAHNQYISYVKESTSKKIYLLELQLQKGRGVFLVI